MRVRFALLPKTPLPEMTDEQRKHLAETAFLDPVPDDEGSDDSEED